MWRLIENVQFLPKKKTTNEQQPGNGSIHGHGHGQKKISCITNSVYI